MDKKPIDFLFLEKWSKQDFIDYLKNKLGQTD
jgi:hypothetical protein